MSTIAFCLSGFLSASAVAFPNDPIASHLEEETRGRVREAALNSKQIAKIQALTADFGPRITEAEQKAAETEAQKAARKDAIERAKKLGKKGLEAYQMVRSAGRSTAEQKEAAASAHQLRHQLDQAIQKVLADAPKTANRPGPKREREGSGMVVVRLVPDYADLKGDSKTLLDLAQTRELRRLAALLKEWQLEDPRRAIPPEILKRLPAKDDKLIRRLASYWKIDVRNKQDSVEQLLRQLDALPEVDFA